MVSERVIAISKKKLNEMKQQLIDEAWKDESADAESIQAYLEDFTNMIIERALKED
jgi:hypothetical protein